MTSVQITMADPNHPSVDADDNFITDKDIVGTARDFTADKRFPNSLIEVPKKNLKWQDQRLYGHTIKESYDDLNVCDSENAKAQILISPTQCQDFPELDIHEGTPSFQEQYTSPPSLSSEQTPDTS